MPNTCYVYTLAYPESMGGAIFYVGKGTGDRINAHSRDARKGKQTKACRVIRSIWQAGQEVITKKVHQNLSDDDATILEARMIRELGIESLANQVLSLRGYNMTSLELEEARSHSERILLAYLKMQREHEALVADFLKEKAAGIEDEEE